MPLKAPTALPVPEAVPAMFGSELVQSDPEGLGEEEDDSPTNSNVYSDDEGQELGMDHEKSEYNVEMGSKCEARRSTGELTTEGAVAPENRSAQ